MLSGCISRVSYEDEAKVTIAQPEVITIPAMKPESLPDAPLLPSDDIFKLSEKQKADFLTYYHAPAQASVRKHHRLSEYLEFVADQFNFRGETLTAQEALERIEGNCLSLAILTAGLANLVGLEVQYQLVNTAPVFMQEKGINIISNHVRTFIYDPDFVKEKGMIYFQRPFVLVDYFPARGNLHGRLVKTDEFISMYYRNLAAKALGDKNYESAWLYSFNALSHKVDGLENINFHAVLLNRLGHYDQAQQWFEYGMKQVKDNVNLVVNYRSFLEKQGDAERAQKVDALLDMMDDPNPYNWISLGEEAYRGKRYITAFKHYAKAAKLAPYIDQAYFGLSKASYEMKELSEARRFMRIAKSKAWLPESKKLYEAKLATLINGSVVDTKE